MYQMESNHYIFIIKTFKHLKYSIIFRNLILVKLKKF
jgi:hypothetical protein